MQTKIQWKTMTLIEQEKDEIQKYLKGLLRILNYSNIFNFDTVFPKLDESQLEEKLAVFKKHGFENDYFNTLFQFEFNYDFYVLMIDKYVQETKSYNLYNKFCIHLIDHNTYENAIKFLNEKAEFLDPSQIIEKIPKTVKVFELDAFLTTLISNRANHLRELEIKNSLLDHNLQIKK
jgi:hypothetical protein